MLVATFGPTTGWAGRTITYYEGRFTLEGHGLVTAHDVLEYDRQGHLTWAYDGLREWAYSLAPPPAAAPAVTMQAPSPQATTPLPVAAGEAQTPAAASATAGPPGAEAGSLTAGPAAVAQEAMAQEAEPAATMVQDMWRARYLDFDARVLAVLGAAGDPGADTLARAARCICWDFPAASSEQTRRALTLYGRDGRQVHTVWTGPDAALLEDGAAAAPPPPPGWDPVDAPWATMAVPQGWMGGAPETAGAAAAAALQVRGPDWAAWAGEWLAPLTTMYASSRGQLAALLFAVDAGAATLDDAVYGVLLRQELDAAHSAITLQGRTDDLARRLGETGLIESVAYGRLAGRPASRIVAETRAGFPHGPRGIHIVQYVFMQPPYTCSLDFTVPSAAPDSLGLADRCAATFVFKG